MGTKWPIEAVFPAGCWVLENLGGCQSCADLSAPTLIKAGSSKGLEASPLSSSHICPVGDAKLKRSIEQKELVLTTRTRSQDGRWTIVLRSLFIKAKSAGGAHSFSNRVSWAWVQSAGAGVRKSSVSQLGKEGRSSDQRACGSEDLPSGQAICPCSVSPGWEVAGSAGMQKLP